MKNYAGGLSKKVTDSHLFQNYVKSGLVFGYIGSEDRTVGRDKILEKLLAETGLGPDGIALWLTSTKARHLMDDVDKNTPLGEFEKRAAEYSETAFEDVTVWAHPDHGGSLRSTIELRRKIFNA